jgi:molybdopterin-containing oxidoreductase family iron-sulfur binding subunit
MTSVVWGSWVEVNPKTAEKLGIKEGDMLSVESPYGKVSAPAYIYAGIRPDTVAMPIGQGHTHYGRYAKGRGANPIEVLPFKENAKTGQIALNSTRVKLSISRTGAGDLVKLEGTARELGRDIVKTISPEELEKTSG